MEPKKLRSEETTKQLISLLEQQYLNLLPQDPGNLPVQRFDVKSGNVLARGIRNTPYYSIAETSFSANVDFPPHSHPQHEYFICIQGAGVVTLAHTEIPITVGDCVHVQPNQSHAFRTEKTGSILLVISVPRNLDFPKGACDEC